MSFLKQNLQHILAYMRGKPLKEEEAPDILRLIYKKRKKASRWNKRKITKRILCMGDYEVPPISFKQSGMLYNTGCAESFWKPSFFTPGQWTFIPTELIIDLNRRAMRVRCRGFKPLGENIWVPELDIHHAKDAKKYRDAIYNHFCDIINTEGSIIQDHLRINSISTASLTKEIDKLKLRMKEALPRVMEDNDKGASQV